MEPDHNYPKPNVLATEICVDADDAIYIYVPNEGMPPNKFHEYTKRLAQDFKEAMPGITVIAGPHDLKFTKISRKQVFKGKLDGTIEDE